MKRQLHLSLQKIGVLILFTLILLASKSMAQKSMGLKAGSGASILKKDFRDDAPRYNNNSFIQPSGL